MTVPKEQKATQQKEREQLIQDIKKNNPKVTDEQLSRYDINDLRKIWNAVAQPSIGNTAGRQKDWRQEMTVDEKYRQEKRLGTFSQKMQYGGMADMSAAPMVKQPQTKKRRAASGFRTKYSKGGGVRSSKYKL